MALILPSRAIIRPRGFIKPRRCALDNTHPLAKALIGCWPLGDNANGINKDVSPFARDMKFVGTSLGAPASHHGGLGFNCGTSQSYLTAPFPQIPYPFTLAIWANFSSRPASNSAWEMFCVSDTTNNRGHYIQNGTGGSGDNHIYFGGYDGTSERKQKSNNAASIDGKWHHYASVFLNSATVNLYIDGIVQTFTTDVNGNPNAPVGNTANVGTFLYTGGPFATSNGYYEGARIYARDLSQSEIIQLVMEPYAAIMPANDILIASNFGGAATSTARNRNYPLLSGFRNAPLQIPNRDFPLV